MKSLIAALSFWVGLATPAGATSLTLTQAGSSGGGNVPFVTASNCSGTDTSNAATVTCTLSAGLGGATVVVMTAIGSGLTVSTVSDGTNSYSKLTAGSGSEDAEIWYMLNPATVASGGTLTVTYGSASTNPRYVHVVTLNKVAAVDQSGNGTGVSNTPTCVTGGSATDGSAAFGIVLANPSGATGGQPSGWAGAVQGPVGVASVIDGNKIVSGAGTQTYAPTGFGVVVWACAVGTFK